MSKTEVPRRIILIDPSNTTREVLANRLRAQGYDVEDTADPAIGADMALCAPPAAVVADLWMPGISGIQLCRLLRSEPATADIVLILCGESDEPRDRFWADRAGANAYVSKHRTGDLVRTLSRTATRTGDDTFFFQLGGGTVDIRDRIARHLDDALFDSVIAAEVRALASCGEFSRLFDLFVQFISQVARYRWVAISTADPERLAIHYPPSLVSSVDGEVRDALAGPLSARDRPSLSMRPIAISRIVDEDAIDIAVASSPVVYDIPFGNLTIGRIALSPCSKAEAESADSLIRLIARELGGPIRMASLVEESQRLAATDALTGLMNRRAFATSMEVEIARSKRYGYPLSIALIDIDHFKKVNDLRGHNAGDRVLQAMGELLRSRLLRRTDLAARWGGEEFVVAYLSTPKQGGAIAAERLRAAIESLRVTDDNGEAIPITASIGLTVAHVTDTLATLINRADQAMYESKDSGRNRMTIAVEDREPSRMSANPENKESVRATPGLE